MSRARILLHLAALVVPIAAAAAWSFALNPADPHLALRQTRIFGGLGVIAAQLAALARWRALDRRARAGAGAWKTGLGMAALTHVLFGMLFAFAFNASLLWLQPGDASSLHDAIMQALFFIAMSMLTIGLLSFPLTAALAQGLAALRARELDAVRPFPTGEREKSVAVSAPHPDPLPGGERVKSAVAVASLPPSCGEKGAVASPPLPSGERDGVRERPADARTAKP